MLPWSMFEYLSTEIIAAWSTIHKYTNIGIIVYVKDITTISCVQFIKVTKTYVKYDNKILCVRSHKYYTK